MSVHFWGENPTGTWKVHVSDNVLGSGQGVNTRNTVPFVPFPCGEEICVVKILNVQLVMYGTEI